MARYQKLSREELLDAALEVILKQGPHALTIGNVAKAAGVTKGGIQSNFGTRENLIEALFDRWSLELEKRYQAISKKSDGTSRPLDIFLQATMESHLDNPKQDAAMFVLVLQDERREDKCHQWINQQLERLGLTEEEAERDKLRFVVHQSMIIAKSFGLMPFSDQQWKKMMFDTDELFKK